MSVVILKYEDLASGKDLTESVFKAYGPGGLGALVISGIPQYAEQRQKLLSQGHKLVNLPKEKLEALEDEKSLYNAGWSFGKEKFNNQVDLSKGSFYANPLYDVPGTPEEMEKYPSVYPPNVWPSGKDMPEFESDFKALGKTMYQVVLLLAKQIDKLCHERVASYKPGLLHDELEASHHIKARLLYYYPPQKEEQTELDDGWIGWHNDSGMLTSLTSAIFLDHATGKIIENPDPMGGLWIATRDSQPVHVKIPADCLAIQCGECLQIISGGLLVATPHCVRASRSMGTGVKVSRVTFPNFVDCGIHFKLSPPAGISRDKVFENTVKSKVPPLGDRWTHDGQTFAEFLKTTFSQYYEYKM